MSEVDDVEKEMNCGFIQLVVLLLLEKTMYGYMIVRVFEQHDILVEESTLYPLPRRLEEKGVLRVIVFLETWHLFKGVRSLSSRGMQLLNHSCSCNRGSLCAAVHAQDGRAALYYY